MSSASSCRKSFTTFFNRTGSFIKLWLRGEVRTRGTVLRLIANDIKADSLPHQATEDIYFENYYFPAGTTFFGSLFAIMHNPKDFPEPETFKPERFLDKDEKFQNDPKVCSFRIVLQQQLIR